jgi:hypothetical protein
MITGELKSKVDRIWDTMWSGGISNPLSGHRAAHLPALHQAARRAPDAEGEQRRPHRPADRGPGLRPDQDHLRWSRFKETAPEKMFATVRDEVFPFIKSARAATVTAAKGDPEDSTYTHHMKDALFMMPTPGAGQTWWISSTASTWPTATPRATSTSTCSARSPAPGRTVSSAPRAHHQADGGDDRARRPRT